MYGPFDTTDPSVKEIKVNLNNYGIVPAENIIVSMNTNSEDIQFLGFTSNPLLSESTQLNTNMTNQMEMAIFKMEVLPPRSENIITARVNDIITRNDLNLVTYVRSDQAVGSHDTLLTFIVYMAVLSVVLPIAIGKIKPWNWISQNPSS